MSELEKEEEFLRKAKKEFNNIEKILKGTVIGMNVKTRERDSISQGNGVFGSGGCYSTTIIPGTEYEIKIKYDGIETNFMFYDTPIDLRKGDEIIAYFYCFKEKRNGFVTACMPVDFNKEDTAYKIENKTSGAIFEGEYFDKPFKPIKKKSFW